MKMHPRSGLERPVSASSAHFLPVILLLAIHGALSTVNAEECDGIFGSEALPLDLEGRPRDVLIADLNGDGAGDLAVALQVRTSTVLKIFMSREDRTFEEPLTFAGETRIESLCAADVDLDGRSDIVAANGDTLLVFGDDRSSFNTIPMAHNSTYVTAGQLVGDPAPDLVVAHDSDAMLTVLENRGGGDFRTTATITVGRQPTSVALGDQDGDGDLDLITANRGADTVSVVRNLGGGSFSDAVSSGDVGRRPAIVRAADLQGDGATDLAVVSLGEVYVLENDGAGSFATPRVLRNDPSRDSQWLDLDADGDEDLAILGNSNRIYPFIGDGAGLLEPRPSLSSYTAGQMLRSGDLDGDGDSDLALADTTEQLSVVWNGSGRNVSLERLDVSGDMRLPHSIAIGDFDNDGFPDVMTGNGGGATMTFLKSLGDGTLASPVNLTVGGRLLSLAAGDFNADGIPDVVGGDQSGAEVHIMISRGDATWDGPFTHATGAAPIKVVTADMNGDGFDEILSADQGDVGTVSMLINLQDGKFELRILPVGFGVQATTAGDFDQDEDMDLAVLRGSDLLVFENDGELNFGEPTLYADPSSPGDVVTADVDLDSDLDIISGSSCYLNRGDGTFAPALPLPEGAAAFSMFPADIDRDGFPDLATVGRIGRGISVFLGNGDGTFHPPFPFTTAAGPSRQVVAGDIDQDGDIEVISSNRNSRSVTVLRNTMEPAFGGDFLEAVCSPQEFHALSRRTSPGDRALNFVVPVRNDDALIPAVFQNTRRHETHESFLESVFAEHFPGGLSPGEYARLTAVRESRQYYAGVLSRLGADAHGLESGVAYGFRLFVDTSRESERLRLDEVQAVYEQLRAAFRLEPLGYFPATDQARADAAEWVNPGFPVYSATGSQEISYRAYTATAGYGRIRILDEETFRQAHETGDISFQNILVLERTPRDIDGLFAGVLTAEEQVEMSPLSLRTERRGAPNAFIRAATLELAPWDGRLVRLEVRESGYEVREASVAEAEQFWSSRHPAVAELPPPDGAWLELSTLAEIGSLDLDAPQEPRFGGAATRLARLGRVLDGTPHAAYREVGFAIPVAFARRFFQTNRIPSASNPNRMVTYEEHLDDLLHSETFRSNSRARFEALAGFREHALQNGLVDPALTTELLQRIPEVFGSTTLPVHFRPSSNVEALLEWNGESPGELAGVCADDHLDENDAGPSRCDPTAAEEQTIERALKRVWTNLYSFRAYEERAVLGVAEELVAMGVLVCRGVREPLANGLAFTGSLTDPADNRYVVTIQVGAANLVDEDPAVRPETDVLELTDGRVTRIHRPQHGSSFLPQGQWILSDAQLEELGQLLGFVDRNFPVEQGDRSREQIILGVEIRVEPDHGLVVKGIRPLLVSSPVAAAPTFELRIPASTMACGVFAEAGAGRGLREEFELKSQLRFIAGPIRLPTVSESFPGELVEEFRFGPDQELAMPISPGLFRRRIASEDESRTIYRFTWSQEFGLPNGSTIQLQLVAPLEFEAENEEPTTPPLVLDDAFLSREPGREALVGFAAELPPVRFGTCSLDHLPRQDVVRAELEDGTAIELEIRWQPSANRLETGPAVLARGLVSAGETVRESTDYWHLVYSAQRHNEEARCWIVLDEPLLVDGLDSSVHVVEVHQAEPHRNVGAQVFYLDDRFRELRQLQPVAYSEASPGETRFRRGDLNGDGLTNLVDAFAILGHLFLGAPPPPCEKSANTDDNDLLDPTDVIYLLQHLFARGPPPYAPYRYCGVDRTPDAFSCTSDSGCP